MKKKKRRPPPPAKKRKRGRSPWTYAKQLVHAAKTSRESSTEGREIGRCPPCKNPPRREATERSLQKFCETYLRATFDLPWSADHPRVFQRTEEATLRGGLFAFAMPRGAGKTSVCEAACLWAVLFGHTNFVCLIGASAAHAKEMLESIKAELDGNELLLDDFPEVCFPIVKLEGISNRCKGQTSEGRRTQIGWTKNAIVLPTIRGSKASGATLKVAGITGRIRGMKHKRPDGKSLRPSLVVIDDPQTRESANSLSQCAKREKTIMGDVLGMAGPGKKISGIMPCTVIRPGDVADRILDRKLRPDWSGERTRMVYSFPKAEKLWAQYAEIRAESFRKFGDIREGTAFYRANREAMDAGAAVAWPERFEPGEISAIQSAMNLRLQDAVAFAAEYQNEPLPEIGFEASDALKPDQIAARRNGLKRGAVPLRANRLTAFIDVQLDLLYFVVCAWLDDFTGYVLDYGAYPDQQRSYFALREARPTLRAAAPGAGEEGAILAGLKALSAKLLGREWTRDDGAPMRIDVCLVDQGWGQHSELVNGFCRSSQHAAALQPSLGRGIKAGDKPMSEYERRPGEELGHNWYVAAARPGQKRHVLFDANYWKGFVRSRLAVALGDPGALSLFGGAAEDHRMIAEHLTAEFSVETFGRGRRLVEWKLRPDAAGENHLLDCVVGCAVGAAMKGAKLAGTDTPRPKRRLVSLAEMKAQAQRRPSA